MISFLMSKALVTNGEPLTSCSANFTSMVYSPKSQNEKLENVKCKPHREYSRGGESSTVLSEQDFHVKAI